VLNHNLGVAHDNHYYAADRTALLIVASYNDFTSEGGKFYKSTQQTAGAVGFYA
jgi:hypothetical protein